MQNRPTVFSGCVAPVMLPNQAFSVVIDIQLDCACVHLLLITVTFVCMCNVYVRVHQVGSMLFHVEFFCIC